jgi:hypothetical protein
VLCLSSNLVPCGGCSGDVLEVEEGDGDDGEKAEVEAETTPGCVDAEVAEEAPREGVPGRRLGPTPSDGRLTALAPEVTSGAHADRAVRTFGASVVGAG